MKEALMYQGEILLTSQGEILNRIVHLANEASFEIDGERSTCIFTCHALHDALVRLGYSARILRVEAHVFPIDRKMGAILGGDGCGSRLPAAEKDMWHGHVAVIVDDKWLLDPTLDQVNREGIAVHPVALELSPIFWSSMPPPLYRIGNCEVRYHPYKNQKGFSKAGDARPCRWKPTAEKIFQQAEDTLGVVRG